MNVWVKRVLIGAGALIGVLGVGGGAFAWSHVSAYEESMDVVYDVPVPEIALSTDPAVLARGKHLAESLVPCASSDCHGTDLGGGKPIAMGPIGTFTGPNVTRGGLGAAYSPGELVRLLQHGIKKDGRSVRFMPAHEWNWLPDADIAAVVSYVATLPPVDKPNGEIKLGAFGKVLDQRDMIPIDIARRIDHASVEKGPPPSATKEYGAYVAKLCVGCHGEHLSGGPIPGAPPDMAVPLNLTPHESGMKGWSFEDFEKVMVTGVRKDGRKLDPMMPTEAFGKMNSVEKRALYEYLKALPPREFGGR